jgi:hypothetical protein
VAEAMIASCWISAIAEMQTIAKDAQRKAGSNIEFIIYTLELLGKMNCFVISLLYIVGA